MACKSHLCDEHPPAYPPVHVYEKGHRCRQDWSAVDMVVAVDSAETWSKMKQFDTHTANQEKDIRQSHFRVESLQNGKANGLVSLLGT